MIVIVGHVTAHVTPHGGEPAGVAARAALTAARAGARVELVGKVGDDPIGDGVLLGLARAGVGHVALLRDPSRPTPQEAPPPPDDAAGVEPALDLEVAPDPEAGRASPALEAADVDLALRYLTDYRVLVLTEAFEPEIVAVAVDAARYTGASLVAVSNAASQPSMPPDALVLEAPAADPEGSFAMLLGEVAAAIDKGSTPTAALEVAATRLGAAWLGAR